MLVMRETAPILNRVACGFSIISAVVDMMCTCNIDINIRLDRHWTKIEQFLVLPRKNLVIKSYK